MVKVLLNEATGEILSVCEDTLSMGVEGRNDLVTETLPDITFEEVRDNFGLIQRDKKMFMGGDNNSIDVMVGGRLDARIST